MQYDLRKIVKSYMLTLDGGGWRLNGAKKRTITLIAEDLNSFVWESGASLLECLEAGFKVDEVEFQAKRCWQSLEELAAGWNDLLANAISWNESCKCEVSYRLYLRRVGASMKLSMISSEVTASQLTQHITLEVSRTNSEGSSSHFVYV